jgi:hypothetical protein
MILSSLAQGGLSLNVVALLASAAAAARQHRTATAAARCGSGTQQAACAQTHAAALDDPPRHRQRQNSKKIEARSPKKSGRGSCWHSVTVSLGLWLLRTLIKRPTSKKGGEEGQFCSGIWFTFVNEEGPYSRKDRNTPFRFLNYKTADPVVIT